MKTEQLMPEALRQRVPSPTLGRPSSVGVRAEPALTSALSRSRLFFVADFVFLVLAGVAATLMMHLIHQLEWPFLPTCIVGMVAAMFIQTLMAFGAAPLLGSIESMVPSMIVGMTSPMTICVLHLFGCESTWVMATVVGSAFAIATFALIQRYARSCSARLSREVEALRG